MFAPCSAGRRPRRVGQRLPFGFSDSTVAEFVFFDLGVRESPSISRFRRIMIFPTWASFIPFRAALPRLSQRFRVRETSDPSGATISPPPPFPSREVAGLRREAFFTCESNGGKRREHRGNGITLALGTIFANVGHIRCSMQSETSYHALYGHSLRESCGADS